MEAPLLVLVELEKLVSAPVRRVEEAASGAESLEDLAFRLVALREPVASG